MKYILITLALILGFQTDVLAQHHRKTSRHRKAQHHRHASYHHRSHGRTFYRTHNVANQPSPYRGDNTPINDGQQKNKQRNLNYNTSQPLPPNNGGR